MPNNTHTFSGAHGTPDADQIQKDGFKIPDATSGTNMFGRGLYFYKNDACGRKFAKMWGELRAADRTLSPERVQILCVPLTYDDDCFFRWGPEEEQHIFDLLQQRQKQSPKDPPTRKVQNELRERYLTQLISQMPGGCALILTDLPLPPRAPKKERYQGCVVLKDSIFPSPPYEVACDV